MVSNIGVIYPYSFQPDANSEEKNQDVHGSSHLQADASE